MRSVVFCLLLSAVAISADLQADVEDVASHLPMKEIESIGKQYVAANPWYADGIRYVNDVTYEKLIKDFFQTEEGQRFIDHFNQRGIEIESIVMYMTDLTSKMIPKWLEPMEEGETPEFAISGDIRADYRKALVEAGFFEAVHKKMEESPEFANLVAAYKDPEFSAVFYHATNSKILYNNPKSPEARRGFWKKVFKVAQVVALGHSLMG